MSAVPAAAPAPDLAPWRLAGSALVKSTGFPYELLEGLRIDGLGGLVESGDDAAIDAAIRQCVAGLVRTCSDPRFLEAVMLSSRTAYEQLDRWLTSGATEGRLRSADRRKVLLAAIYLQRMCAKNESTSFFGPVYWAGVGGQEGFVLEAGPPVPPRLETRWTHWAVQAVADVMSTDPEVIARVAPVVPANLVRRAAGDYISVRYVDWPIEFVPVAEPPRAGIEQRLLARCDGRTTPLQLAEAEGLGLDLVLSVLTDLDRRGLVIFRLQVPVGLIDSMRPLLEFTTELPGAAGRRWRPVVDGLERRRTEFNTAGSLESRRAALTAMAAAFTEVTGRAAEKDAGRHYADRSVVVEDGRFAWPRLDIGEPVHGYLRAELPVVLDLLFELSLARRRRCVWMVTDWFAAAFGKRSVALDEALAAAAEADLGSRLRAADDELRAAGPSALTDQLLANAGTPRVELDLEWARRNAALLDFDTWCVAGADVFISAPDVEAINAGAFQVIVGEVHGLHDQLLQGLWPALHPRRAEFESEIGGLISGLADGRICDPVLAHWRKTIARSEVLPEVEFLGRSPRPADQVCRAAELRIRIDAGRMVLECPEHGRVLLTRPPLRSWADEVESLFTPFTGARLIGAEDMFRDTPDTAHLPRLTVGRTVVHRESWRIPPPQDRSWSSLAAGNQRRVLRLKERYALPDQVYARFPGEPKPIFVDFEVPVLVDLFARHHARATGPVTVVEMLPGPDDLWLRDRCGRHTSELRFGYYRRADGGGI